jgi:hypothetical protein
VSLTQRSAHNAFSGHSGNWDFRANALAVIAIAGFSAAQADTDGLWAIIDSFLYFEWPRHRKIVQAASAEFLARARTGKMSTEQIAGAVLDGTAAHMSPAAFGLRISGRSSEMAGFCCRKGVAAVRGSGAAHYRREVNVKIGALEAAFVGGSSSRSV